MSYSLQTLGTEENRRAVLIAEVGGLLHNLGKLHENFLLTILGNQPERLPYRFKRIAQPSSSLLNTRGKEIVKKSGKDLEASLFKPEYWDDDEKNDIECRLNSGQSFANCIPIVQQKIRAARNFSVYSNAPGTSPLHPAQEAELRRLVLQVKDENWPLADLLTLFWDSPFNFIPDQDRPARLDAIGHWLNQGTRLTRLLALAHGVNSMIEKSGAPAAELERLQSVSGKGQVQQTLGNIFVSSAFGWERPFIDRSKLESLRNDIFSALTGESFIKERINTLQSVSNGLIEGLGDTQRPINDITLWDFSAAIAALYKSAVAKSILENEIADTATMQWRILRISINGPEFYGRVAKLPDLLIRRRLLLSALDAIKRTLEESYPIGNEVYRDEYGSAFVMPYLKDDQEGAILKDLLVEYIQKPFLEGALQGEITPGVSLSQPSYEARGLAQFLMAAPPPAQPDLSQVKFWWTGRLADICSVCNLRPQGERGSKSWKRKVCRPCEVRREERAASWSVNLDTTIWLDEVADEHGRFALVAGQFALDHWVDGSMIKTMMASTYVGKKDHDGKLETSEFLPKNDSFARLRRVWETTNTFWRDIEEGLSESDQVGLTNPRLRLFGTFEPIRDGEVKDENKSTDTPVASHTYEIRVRDYKLSLLCVTSSEFLTCENLYRAARLLGAPAAYLENYCAAAMYVRDCILRDKSFQIEEPAGYGQPRKLRGKLVISTVDPEPTAYCPALPIVAEPRTFMALVPAQNALAIIQRIKTKYETEMGKVRNRLPVTLGVVFASSRTPLSAILDAGRRMLMSQARPSIDEESWQVANTTAAQLGEMWPGKIVLTLTRGDRRLTIRVPVLMGDRTTKDHWYPYWQVVRDQSGEKPNGRQLQFADSDQNVWVHVSDLQKGDAVRFTPSCFDFEFLDTAARRFEISYLNGRRRSPTQQARPFFLEEIDELMAVWQLLSKGLATTQIKTIEGLIEEKRSTWLADLDGQDRSRCEVVFRQFISDALRNAPWRQGQRPTATEFERLERAAIGRQLSDVVELFSEILKLKAEPDSLEVS